METLKTAAVVVLLLAVLYGVYSALNKPTEPFPEGMAWQQPEMMEPLDVDLGPNVDAFSSGALEATAPVADLETSLPPTTPPVAAIEPVDPGSTNGVGLPNPQASEPAPESPPPATAWPNATSVDEPAEPVASQTGESEAVPAAPTTTSATPVATGGGSSYYASAATEITPGTETATQPATSKLEQSQPTGNLYSDNAYAQAAADARTATPAFGAGSPDADTNTTNGSGDPNAASATSVPVGEFGSNSAYGTDIQPPSRFSPFDNAMQSALSKIEEEQWYDALWTLSLFYDSPDLTSEQLDQLVAWLDPLAAKVVYSTEHLIEPAYMLQRGDTLPAIGERYGVPWQLLANINSIQNPELLTAGTALKVVRGPFRATVDLQRGELTLFAGKLYAGRFPISTGNDPAPEAGEYVVQDKQPGHAYYAGNGETIAVGNPTNPFGKVWLDLGNGQSIHGSPQEGSATDQGCISLSPQDANDLYGILSQGSSIIIRR